MKTKIAILLFAISLLQVKLFAQKIAADKVPSAVAGAVKAKFPAATDVKWEMEKKNVYEAVFKLNGNNVSANFDSAGKWMETETEIKVSDLPAPVNATLKKDFTAYKVAEASRIESVKHGNCFEAEIEKGKETIDVLFSADGKVLSKSKEKEEKGEKEKEKD